MMSEYPIRRMKACYSPFGRMETVLSRSSLGVTNGQVSESEGVSHRPKRFNMIPMEGGCGV